MIDKINTRVFQILDFINDEDGSATYESITREVNNFPRNIDERSIKKELDILIDTGFVQTYNDDGQVYYNITYKVRDLLAENFNITKRI